MSDKLPEILSTPGNIDTAHWFNNLSKESAEIAAKPGSVVELAKSQEIWFCDIPFTQVFSQISGTYQACCFGAEQKEHTVNNTTIKEWMEESEYMNSIREEMLDPNSDHIATDHICRRCKSEEAKFGRSRRTNVLKLHGDDKSFWDATTRAIENYKALGNTWIFEERNCEIQLKVWGSQCNLDCHMCNHDNSTTRTKVAEEGVWNDIIFDGKLGNRQHLTYDQKMHKIRKVINRSYNLTEIIAEIVELSPYIRSIKIIGGESTIMKKQYKMLDGLIAVDQAKNIKIKFQTNLYQMKSGKHNMFNYIPQFLGITMVASIDGIGKYNDYMRRQSHWEQIEANLDLLGSDAHPNTKVDFNSTIGFLSILRFYEVIEYCEGNPAVTRINWNYIESPKHLRPNNLPRKIKDALIPKYEGHPDLIGALEKEAESDCDIQEVFKYLLDQDKYYIGTPHELHLFEVYPELEEYYVKP